MFALNVTGQKRKTPKNPAKDVEIKMQYEVTQIISYLVTAETPDEALDKWNNNPRIAKGVIQWTDGDVEVLDERIEVNG